ncbi:MAG: hypothetical protein FJ104_04325, partial [Deltaproteobacteria bacterium]|nr:hypothetical protein [Deltaproteobacteria bacterium]
MVNRAATFSLDRYAPEARALVAEAQRMADQRTHTEVEPLHLLARLLERGGRPAEVLRAAGVEPAALARG